ncbi:helix-turn-helix domain-containing protein [Planococcus lenghuensis]|uniref:HTH cro/C1-type domain-containing protein n=1 Tax=Planococcus lenghuensis TaxID=2213202 RepID=A0A1Q2L5D7_9BACL|nr:helix-turn-helix transcriptional regulator [Planococcus lenghuensis]AQQ55584.1 hypothetical protein B0X71_20645 [Planococcus lenghuensis]
MTSKNEHDIYEKIGSAMKAIRKEQKLTLQDIEARSELKPSTVSLIERGKQNFSIGWLVHYCNTLDVDPAEVFTRAFRDDFQNQQLDKIFERFDAYEAKKDEK